MYETTITRPNKLPYFFIHNANQTANMQLACKMKKLKFETVKLR